MTRDPAEETKRVPPPGGASGPHAKPGTASGSHQKPAGPKSFIEKLTPVDFMILFLALAIGATLLLPGMWAKQMADNEGAALGFLREIHRLQEEFKAKKGGRHATTLLELAAVSWTGPAPEGGTVSRDGYTFRIAALDERGARYYATAQPQRFGQTGERAFYVDDTGIVRQSAVPVVGPAFPEAQ